MSPQTTIALFVAFGALIFIGMLVTAGGGCLALVLVVMQIWERVRPKVDHLATVEAMASINRESDRRYKENKDAIMENREENTRHFQELRNDIKEVSKDLGLVRDSFAEFRTVMAQCPLQHAARERKAAIKP